MCLDSVGLVLNIIWNMNFHSKNMNYNQSDVSNFVHCCLSMNEIGNNTILSVHRLLRFHKFVYCKNQRNFLNFESRKL